MTVPHRKTCKRFNVAGHAHSLTFSCFRRQPFLSRDRSCQWLVYAIDRARSIHQFHVWAYAIMPEHVHLLLWPTQVQCDIGKILESIKLPVAKRAITFGKRESPRFLDCMQDRQPNGRSAYRFWQRGGGYDRNIDEPATAHRETEYIHGNPVRRRLCQLPTDYYWSSAADWAGVRCGPLSIDRESLPLAGQFLHRVSR